MLISVFELLNLVLQMLFGFYKMLNLICWKVELVLLKC